VVLSGSSTPIYQAYAFSMAGGYMDFGKFDRAWMHLYPNGAGSVRIMDGIGLDVLFDLLMVLRRV